MKMPRKQTSNCCNAPAITAEGDICSACGEHASYEWYRIYYRCPNDGHEWTDEWACHCNSRCPKCRAEIEPYRVEELDKETGEIIEKEPA